MNDRLQNRFLWDVELLFGRVCGKPAPDAQDRLLARVDSLVPFPHASIERLHAKFMQKPSAHELIVPAPTITEDYYEVIRYPMDLGTVGNMLRRGAITTTAEYARLVRLTFINVRVFNAPGSSENEAAADLYCLFEEKLEQVMRQCLASVADQPATYTGAAASSLSPSSAAAAASSFSRLRGSRSVSGRRRTRTTRASRAASADVDNDEHGHEEERDGSHHDHDYHDDDDGDDDDDGASVQGTRRVGNGMHTRSRGSRSTRSSGRPRPQVVASAKRKQPERASRRNKRSKRS